MNIGNLVLSNSDDIIIALSLNAVTIEFNRTAERMLSLKRGQILGKNFFSFCNKKQIKIPFNFSQIEKSRDISLKFGEGKLIVNKRGTQVQWKAVFCEETAYPTPLYLVIVKDISELKYYIEENESNKIYLKNILENLPEYIYCKDANLVYQGCNKRVAEYLGLESPDDILGKTDYDFGWDEERIRTLHEVDLKILNTGETVVIEDIIPKPDGLQRIMLTSKSPLRCDQNKIVGVLGVSVDITELKNLEKKLRTTEASEARFKAMSALGGMIAHELRTPLTALGMSSTVIQQLLPILIEGYEKSAEMAVVRSIRKDRLQALKTSVANMGNSIGYAQMTIDMILKGFHYSNKDTQIEITPFLMKDMINKAISHYPFDLDEQHLLTLKHIDDAWVLGQEQMVIHVIHNLLKNALHAIGEAGKGKVIIWTELQKGFINLYVEDTAKGIPTDQLQHIFEPFYTTKKKAALSVGLGLYFCRIVLQKMGGDIGCQSKLGEYTRFKITLTLRGLNA